MYGVNVNFLNLSGKIFLYVVVEIGSYVVVDILLWCNGYVNKCDYLF